MSKKNETTEQTPDNAQPITVGWEEWVSLPDLHLPAIKAKVDTGARTSALHAFSVEPFSTGTEDKVRFGIHPVPERPEIEVYCSGRLVGRRQVRSSNGESELRYIIRTPMTIGDRTWDIEVSLTNRENMEYRMLLGRAALNDGVVIDPMASCVQGQLSAALYDDLLEDQPRRRSLKIGILSREPRNYSTQRLVQAAEQRGHLVEVINTTRCYINITAKKHAVFYGDRDLTGFDAIIPRIGASITHYGMAVVRQFESIGVYALNSARAIGVSRDKLYAHQLLAEAGVGMPVTAMAHSPSDIRDMVQSVGGAPLIIKLLEGTQGRGVVLAETRQAAESVIGAFRGLKANLLVQEFIKEAGGSDLRCIVLGNRVIATMIRQAADGEFRSNLHRGGKSTRARISASERAAAIKAARALGLNFAGVDILRGADGPKVLEVNSSPGIEGIETTTGADIAGAAIEFIEKDLASRQARRKRRRTKAAGG